MSCIELAFGIVDMWVVVGGIGSAGIDEEINDEIFRIGVGYSIWEWMMRSRIRMMIIIIIIRMNLILVSSRSIRNEVGNLNRNEAREMHRSLCRSSNRMDRHCTGK